MVVALSGMNCRWVLMAVDIELFIDNFLILVNENHAIQFMGRGMFDLAIRISCKECNPMLVSSL